MCRTLATILVMAFSSAAFAVQFTGLQTNPTTWTYLLTFDPLDNFLICQPVTTITLSGLSGVQTADSPIGATAQILNGGTTVVWTLSYGGTGNMLTPIPVFGFTITANAQSGLASFATSGMAHDAPCTRLNNLDIAGTVAGPTGAQPSLRVLPVVGSTAGFGGSQFKTSVQLYNPKDGTIAGKVTFHTQGVSGGVADPSLAYSIAPGATVSYADLLPAMGITSGLGSADLTPSGLSTFPISTVRIFNDNGAAGTEGLAEEQMAPADALRGGTAVLITPADPQKFRFNIGVRTLEAGATIAVTVRDKSGNIVKNTTKSYGPTFFTQSGSSPFLDGYELTGGESISFAITAGSAFIYGTTNDNVTSDPSIQFARRVE
jgi:hypothetical protein